MEHIPFSAMVLLASLTAFSGAAVAQTSPSPTAIVSTPLATESVDFSWLSIANVLFEIGDVGILADGYITRIPQAAFYGGGGGLAFTRQAYKPDVAGVERVLSAIGGSGAVNLLLTGHSHFDHSFDTATWSRLTGARIVGSATTCFQAQAEGLAPERCSAVVGGERVVVAPDLRIWVVRWNHSGTSEANPEQHDPIELREVPEEVPPGAGLRAGVSEDFPNGGGGRAFLFRLDTPQGPLSWFYNNSAAAGDLHLPIIVDGIDYGAPLENLRRAMADAGLERVDLWLGSGGLAVAELIVPLLRPAAHLPIHWDGLWSPFFAGLPTPFSSRTLEAYLQRNGVEILRPRQYMDKWRLTRGRVEPVVNDEVKRALGFPSVAPFGQ